MKQSVKRENSGFFHRVHDLVATIPAGKVVTYGHIAKQLGGVCSARAVGFAMRAAPRGRALPCHRVINAKGEMSPGAVFGSPERQRKLLKSEGVRFRRDGTVNFEKSLYQFPVR